MVNEVTGKRKVSGKKIAAKCAIYFVLLLMYAPLIYITVFSFTSSTTTGTWGGFDLKNYTSLFNVSGNIYSQKIWDAVGNTMKVALVASLLSTILGTLGAIGIYNLRNRHLRNGMDFVTQIPVVNAEIVTAVSLLVLFLFFKSVFGLPLSFGTLVIGHIVLSIPYVVMSVTPKLEQMDPSLYEAALDLGATPSQGLTKVIIPQIMPGIFSGFLLSITLSLDDFIVTAFTRGPGLLSGDAAIETLSTYIQTSLKKHTVPAELRPLTLIIFLVVLAIVLGITLYKNHTPKTKRRGLKANESI